MNRLRWAAILFALAGSVSVIAQPAVNFINARVRLDSNGSLMVAGTALGATQGPATNLANTRVKLDSNGSLLVALNGGTITPNILCLDATTQDAGISRTAAATFALGSCTQGNASATVNAATFAGGTSVTAPVGTFATSASTGTFTAGTSISTLNYITTAAGSSTGAVLSAQKVLKSVTGIADATTTPTITVTVPNAAHSAVVRLTILGSLGAGGAIGANECSATLDGSVVLTRTAGVATVATAAAAALTGSACVAGATTMTLAYAVTAMTGDVSATQTFTVNVTITKGGGASANHTAIVLAEIVNKNATGVTIS